MAQESEYNRVVQLFEKVGKEGKVIGNISPDHNKEGDLLGSAEAAQGHHFNLSY